MNRRGFLGILGAAAAGFALDPELALWVPGRKSIFLPPVTHFRGVAPNVGQIVASAWEDYVKSNPLDVFHGHYWLLDQGSAHVSDQSRLGVVTDLPLERSYQRTVEQWGDLHVVTRGSALVKMVES